MHAFSCFHVLLHVVRFRRAYFGQYCVHVTFYAQRYISELQTVYMTPVKGGNKVDKEVVRLAQVKYEGDFCAPKP